MYSSRAHTMTILIGPVILIVRGGSKMILIGPVIIIIVRGGSKMLAGGVQTLVNTTYRV